LRAAVRSVSSPAMRSAPILLLTILLAVAPAAGQTSQTPTKTRHAAKTRRQKKLTAAPSGRRAESRWAGEAISLDLKDADLKDVLHTFAELTGLNIAVDPEVKGSVTVRLHDVPWDQALDLIVRANGFGYVLEGNLLHVGTVQRLAEAP